MRLNLIIQCPGCMSLGLVKAEEESLPVTGQFGDLRSDGFRLMRWDEDSQGSSRHWFDGTALVLCLNVSGQAEFRSGERFGCAVEPGSMVIASSPGRRQLLERTGQDKHRFIVIEMRRTWIQRWFPKNPLEVREPVRFFLLKDSNRSGACQAFRMTAPVAQLATDLLQPPRVPAAWSAWHHGKTLEVVSHAFFIAEDEEFFCERTRRLGRERIQRVKEILLSDLEHPPDLAELGRRVGCSPFYLSRTFRQETGETISSFLRAARLERAARMLKAGEGNVTETALAVGYSSLSHFSKAFSKAYGCCPCLYGKK